MARIKLVSNALATYISLHVVKLSTATIYTRSKLQRCLSFIYLCLHVNYRFNQQTLCAVTAGKHTSPEEDTEGTEPLNTATNKNDRL